VGSGVWAVSVKMAVTLWKSSAVRSRARSETVRPSVARINAMIKIFLDLRRLMTVRPAASAR